MAFGLSVSVKNIIFQERLRFHHFHNDATCLGRTEHELGIRTWDNDSTQNTYNL